MPDVKAPDPIDVYVGERVQALRLQNSISQETLAKKIGLTFQQVHKYEKGVNRVSASRLQQICKILGVPVALLFEGAPRPKGRPSPPSLLKELLEIMRTSEGRRVIKAVGGISTHTRTELARLIELIADARAPKRAYRKKTPG